MPLKVCRVCFRYSQEKAAGETYSIPLGGHRTAKVILKKFNKLPMNLDNEDSDKQTNK